MRDVRSYLAAGDAVGLGIWWHAGGGHAITCWGYNYDPSKNPATDRDYFLGVWTTDSDDNKGDNADATQIVNTLRYSTVTWEPAGGHYHMTSYAFGSPFIGEVDGLEQDPSPSPPSGSGTGVTPFSPSLLPLGDSASAADPSAYVSAAAISSDTHTVLTTNSLNAQMAWTPDVLARFAVDDKDVTGSSLLPVKQDSLSVSSLAGSLKPLNVRRLSVLSSLGTGGVLEKVRIVSDLADTMADSDGKANAGLAVTAAADSGTLTPPIGALFEGLTPAGDVVVVAALDADPETSEA
jgi:hypothetical protein